MIEGIEFWSSLLVTTGATLIAAYGGAKYAFTIQNKSNKEQRDAENLAAGNMALFMLMRYHNKFLNIERQMIGSMRTHPHRHHFIRPSLVGEGESLQFDFSSLSFIISSHANILGAMSALEQDIKGTFEIIDQRSRIHFEQLQPTVERLENERAPDTGVSVEEVEAALGTKSTSHLKSCTEYMIRGVDRALENSKALSVELGQALLQKFPDAQVIKIADDDSVRRSGGPHPS